MKSLYVIGKINLKKYYHGTDRHTYEPTLALNLFNWQDNSDGFYFSHYGHIYLGHIQGLKRMLKHAKHWVLYCTVKKALGYEAESVNNRDIVENDLERLARK